MGLKDAASDVWKRQAGAPFEDDLHADATFCSYPNCAK
jgi:hypothetical protein